MQIRGTEDTKQAPRTYGRRTVPGRTLTLVLEILTAAVVVIGLMNGIPGHTHTVYGPSVDMTPHTISSVHTSK